ncbi:NADH-ubiquinone oxidoreductase 9.5 kDa subunit like protein [Verticillium longisporum]|uniref:NADH-ubiquinone oxidoreductase 9.5 kDa subunit like protein n=2 Tax=Verticillium longisporum TaxID=100787 RepID=A0A8I3AUU4_VERLO|nr:NADH-ubiquinone oxidoreductase 9.5 kDa subunit like protein [Verticillium longisporum]
MPRHPRLPEQPTPDTITGQLTPKMTYATPRFWAAPLTYLRWASRERPAYFWSIVIGVAGPVQLAIVPPVRKMLGDENAPQIPVTYPVPSGQRKQLTGYDDE